MVFFASDIPGGYGLTDIYVSAVDASGNLGTPKNLGPEVNSAGEDMFPFFVNNKLYFVSDGHYGWGGLDIYESKMKPDMSFTAAKNLGAPVNSNRDDFAYVVDASDKNGYFSSNRESGKGDDDIYFLVKAPAICDELVSGKVVNAKSKTAISGASVMVSDPNGKEIATSQSDAQGNYNVKLPYGKTYTFVATKAGHSPEEKQPAVGKTNLKETKDFNFELTNYDNLIVRQGNTEKIAINPIFFEYDKWDITPQAATELDKVVFAMNKFPNLRNKIESHTDSRGKDAYNLKLSDNRAKSTRDYIVSKGIPADKIESAIGYGETRLVNKCKNGVKCKKVQHLANRRSDFIVI